MAIGAALLSAGATGNGLFQFAHILFEHLGSFIFAPMGFSQRHARVAVQHRTAEPAGKPNMNLAHSGALEDVGGVIGCDPSTRHDGDSPIPRLHQLRNGLDAMQTGLFAARGENPIRSTRANVFQRSG